MTKEHMKPCQEELQRRILELIQDFELKTNWRVEIVAYSPAASTVKIAVKQPTVRLDHPSGGTRCLHPQLRSFQFPFESLQCGGSLVCSNNRLATVAIADAHQTAISWSRCSINVRS
jgi:hypothetical protein